MGFLKFLKREKKQDFDDFDLPPAPPPLEGFEESMPEPPELPDFGEKISAPEYKEEDFKFNLPEKEEPMPELEDMDLDKELDMGKDFEKELAMPEMEPEEPTEPVQSQRSIPNIPAAQTISAPAMEEHMEEAEEKQAIQDMYSRRLFAHKPHMRQRPTSRSVYVRIEDFKAMLGTISIIRNDLRKSEETLVKLETIKNSKDRSFDRIKSHLDDLQKKLIFVDKTLFEEE